MSITELLCRFAADGAQGCSCSFRCRSAGGGGGSGRPQTLTHCCIVRSREQVKTLLLAVSFFAAAPCDVDGFDHMAYQTDMQPTVPIEPFVFAHTGFLSLAHFHPFRSLRSTPQPPLEHSEQGLRSLSGGRKLRKDRQAVGAT